MTIKIKQKFKRIITHSGRFHADEVFAIAFLLFHNLVETDYEIVRLKNYDNFNKKNTNITKSGYCAILKYYPNLLCKRK